jgi:hypothetical protein
MGTMAVMADTGKVEISFCVGDETLIINSSPVTVEKPYVVGAGVTLVPLRVITEAFGAKVDWENSTRTITITYPDVVIVLQIDNPIAQVNGKAEALLSAPELSSGFTMVPLRFISETFGAEVSYDENTQRITVVKDNSSSGGMIVGSVDSAKIGDSYYKWSMENPTDMEMDYREFDGTYTSFANEGGEFAISITATEEDYDFEKDFMESKNSLAGYTLIKADKSTQDPSRRTMHFQAKDKENIINFRHIVTDKYSYSLFGIFEIASGAQKDEALRIMDTFNTVFKQEDTHDLSNVKNGMRRFEAETLKASFDVPQNYYILSGQDSINSFAFNSMDPEDLISGIHFQVYSKNEVGGAKTMAEKDYKGNRKTVNEDISLFSAGVTGTRYAGIDAYEYHYTIKHSLLGTQYTKDVFFDKGDYTYNISISVKEGVANSKDLIEKILNSIKLDTVDSEEVGILIRNDPDATGTYTVTMEDAKLQVPNNYYSEGENPLMLLNSKTGIYMSFQKIPADDISSHNELLQTAKDIEKATMENKKTSITSGTRTTSIGSFKYATFSIKSEKDDVVVYSDEFVMLRNKKLYVFVVAYPENFYSLANREEVMHIMETLQFD